MISELTTERNSIRSFRRGHLGWCIALFCLFAGLATAAPQAPEKYVQVGAGGAKLYNLPDPKGHVVLDVSAGTPLAVYGTYAGGRYLKVAAPGGVKVWVFGKYVEESTRLGWVEISGSYVNMRPLPRSQDAYPLGQLDEGDRLLFIGRKDESKAMAEDWVQVYSTPDTMSYVLAAKTTAMPAGADPAALWSEATAVAVAAHEKGGAPVVTEAAQKSTAATPAEAVATAAPQGVFQALAVADRKTDEELAKEKPDYAAAIAAYEAVLAIGPDAPTRKLVDQRIERVKRYEELAEIRNDIALAEAERQRKLAEAQAQIDEMNRGRDPLWGRFQTRGWIEQVREKGEKIYLVRWGSEYTARVLCSSGRYELGIFQGFEVGVEGIPVSAAPVRGKTYPVIEIDRLEVISGRSSSQDRD